MDQYNSGTIYLSRRTLAKAAIKKNFMTITGGILTVFFAMAVLMSITGFDADLRKNLLIYVICLIPSVLLLVLGLKAVALIKLANRYNSIFECDRDGVVTISELTKQTGKENFKILSELELLIEKGFLCNYSLQKQGQPCVMLSDGSADRAGFLNVVCGKCGGTTRLNAGTSGACEYCGNALIS